MQKIISLFQRNYEGDRLVRDEVVPGAEWVQDGEGVATVKHDGTCCLVRDGALYRRYEVRKGGKAPENFEPASDVDPNTGKQQGWVPVNDGPEDRWHREGFAWLALAGITDGTYELVGPKVQGNPGGYSEHRLLRHGDVCIDGVPRDYAGLKEWLTDVSIEGVVWHHPDGRMVKIKARDFGIKR